ncbi:MAG TPA: hypothetical protein GX008_06375 [Firmicutes bacterium]|jgi:hypothetical protein|nr:MAG: hypothetical protein AA931_04245 [Peptococcaceae bacterium 1109]HHT73319.1 hypothetical protein [Bacillota bacterium]
MIRPLAVVLILALAAALPAVADNSVFVDPKGLFQTSIPREWVYQAQQSSGNLSVFYGPGNYNLVYFEVLEPVTYEDAVEYLYYALSHLKGPGGLESFQMEEGPEQAMLQGVAGASAAYSYKASSGHRQFELRVIALLGEDQAVSITFSDEQGSFAATKEALAVVLEEWRWLF